MIPLVVVCNKCGYVCRQHNTPCRRCKFLKKTRMEAARKKRAGKLSKKFNTGGIPWDTITERR